nr:phage regulatory CII family protein [Bosea sp. Root381]
MKMIGTHEDAGAIAGVSKTQMHRWAHPQDSDLITLTAAMKLEAECGMPCVSEVMAAQSGFRLVSAEGKAPPNCMVTAFAGIADEFGEVSGRVADAIQDGLVSPNEHTAINDALHKLAEAVRVAKGTSASLRAVDEMRRAS